MTPDGRVMRARVSKHMPEHDRYIIRYRKAMRSDRCHNSCETSKVLKDASKWMGLTARLCFPSQTCPSMTG